MIMSAATKRRGALQLDVLPLRPAAGRHAIQVNFSVRSDRWKPSLAELLYLFRFLQLDEQQLEKTFAVIVGKKGRGVDVVVDSAWLFSYPENQSVDHEALATAIQKATRASERREILGYGLARAVRSFFTKASGMSAIDAANSNGQQEFRCLLTIETPLDGGLEGRSIAIPDLGCLLGGGVQR